MSRTARVISLEATKIRSLGALAFLIAKSGYSKLREKTEGVSDVHLRLTREHGALMIYGVTPRTPLYTVEMDVSKGYPMPSLTCIS